MPSSSIPRFRTSIKWYHFHFGNLCDEFQYAVPWNSKRLLNDKVNLFIHIKCPFLQKGYTCSLSGTWGANCTLGQWQWTEAAPRASRQISCPFSLCHYDCQRSGLRVYHQNRVWSRSVADSWQRCRERNKLFCKPLSINLRILIHGSHDIGLLNKHRCLRIPKLVWQLAWLWKP